MISRSCCVYRMIIPVLLCCFTSLGSAKGFADRFREFVLGTDDPTVSETASLPDATAATSQQCMACHDGSGGTAIALKDAGSAMRYSGTHNVDHPVGMDYASYAYRFPVEYVAPERLDQRILLEDGRVTCLSCHETKTPEQLGQENLLQVNQSAAGLGTGAGCTATDRLTTGTHQTTLCLSCHAM